MITYCGSIQQWECDHMGHLNVTGYMSRFNEATWVLFSSVGIDREYMIENKIGMSAVRHEINYTSELLPGDTCYIDSRVIAVGNSSLKVNHTLFKDPQSKICASCSVTAVHIDRNSRKPIRIPNELRSSAVPNSENGRAIEPRSVENA